MRPWLVAWTLVTDCTVPQQSSSVRNALHERHAGEGGLVSRIRRREVLGAENDPLTQEDAVYLRLNDLGLLSCTLLKSGENENHGISRRRAQGDRRSPVPARIQDPSPCRINFESRVADRNINLELIILLES